MNAATVEHVRDLRLSVHPLISRDGRHDVVVANRGHSPALLTLATEEGGALATRVVVVEPRDEVRVGLVIAGGPRFVGRRPRPHRVAVWADVEGAPDRLEAAALYFQAPLRWKPGAAAVAAVVTGVTAVLISIALNAGRSPEPPMVAPKSEPVPSNCAPFAGAGAGAVDVEIESFTYCPSTIMVAAGTEVTWRNGDLAAHSATAEGVFDTGLLRQGRAAVVRFDRPGTYPYFCTLHPAMRGTVVVTA